MFYKCLGALAIIFTKNILKYCDNFIVGQNLLQKWVGLDAKWIETRDHWKL